MNGFEFRVQVKSTFSFVISKEKILTSRIKKSTFLYWITGFTPTLLVLYEEKNNSGYYYWINDLVRENPELINTPYSTLHLKIPMPNKIDNNCWEMIRNDLILHKEQIKKIFQYSSEYKLLVPILHDFHLCIDGLAKSHGFEPKREMNSEHANMLTSLTQVISHKEFILTLEKYSKLFKLGSHAEKILLCYIEGYKEICRSFIQDFDLLLKTKEIIATYINKEIMDIERVRLMERITNILVSITENSIK